MFTVEPTGEVLGATVRGIDLSRPLGDDDFGAILGALGAHGVLCFPDQTLDAAALRDFSQRFGEIQATSGEFHDPDVPEVGILSNVIENGRPIGLADAGQDWHTDMSYNRTIGFVNVLYAVKVPRRDGRVLGGTAFVNTRAAYDDLPSDIKLRLEGMTATHDFNKFWENMRQRPGSRRGPSPTSSVAAARRSCIPSSSPIRSRDGGCSIAIPATPSASTSWTKPRATRCLPRSSSISSRRSFNTSIAGPSATCSCGTTSAPFTTPSPTTVPTSSA